MHQQQSVFKITPAGHAVRIPCCDVGVHWEGLRYARLRFECGPQQEQLPGGPATPLLAGTVIGANASMGRLGLGGSVVCK